MITAELVVKFRDAETAAAIDTALSPDNVNLPRNMELCQTRRGKTLRVEVSVKQTQSLDTLISTLDELVSHIQATLETLQKVG